MPSRSTESGGPTAGKNALATCLFQCEGGKRIRILSSCPSPSPQDEHALSGRCLQKALAPRGFPLPCITLTAIALPKVAKKGNHFRQGLCPATHVLAPPSVLFSLRPGRRGSANHGRDKRSRRKAKGGEAIEDRRNTQLLRPGKRGNPPKSGHSLTKTGTRNGGEHLRGFSGTEKKKRRDCWMSNLLVPPCFGCPLSTQLLQMITAPSGIEPR